eukprot:25293-Chlamydomonas_euryale.AAC.2
MGWLLRGGRCHCHVAGAVSVLAESRAVGVLLHRQHEGAAVWGGPHPQPQLPGAHVPRARTFCVSSSSTARSASASGPSIAASRSEMTPSRCASAARRFTSLRKRSDSRTTAHSTSKRRARRCCACTVPGGWSAARRASSCSASRRVVTSGTSASRIDSSSPANSLRYNATSGTWQAGARMPHARAAVGEGRAGTVRPAGPGRQVRAPFHG